jgi:hypothetical protein
LTNTLISEIISGMPLLLLHERHSPDDADIWRVAVRRGWITERVNRYNVAARLPGHEIVRYYGNLLHLDQIGALIPITFHQFELSILADLKPFTKRDICLMKFGELVLPLKKPTFIKPACVKWFEAKVYQPGEIPMGAPEINDYIYTSTPVDYLDEVRCFCVDGKVLTSSLYRINRVVWDRSGLDEDKINFDDRVNDTPIPQYLEEIYKAAKLPRAIVADFGRHPDGSWSLIEFNEPWASGLYFCSPDKCFDCIVASQDN